MPLNKIVQDSVNGGVAGTGPAFRAYNSSAQSITANTFTKVNFDTEAFDTNNNFSSSRFTPTVAGYYQINASLIPGGTGTTRALIGIFKNGAADTFGNDFQSATYNVSVSGLVYCNGTTDYIEIYTFINATSPTITSGSANPFSGCLVRAS